MRKFFLLAAVAVLVTAAASSAGTAKIVSFRMPSRNIGCAYGPAGFGQKGFLRCDIVSGLVPRLHRACELDWTGLGISKRGRRGWFCAGDTVYDRGAPILRYGRTWRVGGFTCHSRRKGLTCSNRRAHGLFLSRRR